MDEISKFIQDQLSVWALAATNFRALKAAETREMEVGGLKVRIQHNPCRIISTTADVSPEVIAARKCFLCVDNRPKEQFHLKFEGRKRRKYNIQVNPYPIFPSHLVIARDVHTPQSIWHYFVDMMDLSRKYPDFLVFYNGPQSGASAPDHMHFQACPKNLMPLQTAVDEYLRKPSEPLATLQDARLYHFPYFCRGIYALSAKTPKSLAKLFYRLADSAPLMDGENEPRMNMFAYCVPGEYRCIVVLRSQSRSHHYYSEGEDHLTMAPGAADMAGVLVCPNREDFDKLTRQLLSEILDEVTLSARDEEMVAWRLSRKQPKLQVPVLRADEMVFEIISDGSGPQSVKLREGRIDYSGDLYDELYFDSVTRSTVFDEPSFILHAGRTLKFGGALKLAVVDGHLQAYNYIGVENYLLSVMSSRLPSDMPFEEVCRAVIEERAKIMADPLGCKPYTGLTSEIKPAVRKAVDMTWGKVE